MFLNVLPASMTIQIWDCLWLIASASATETREFFVLNRALLGMQTDSAQNPKQQHDSNEEVPNNDNLASSNPNIPTENVTNFDFLYGNSTFLRSTLKGLHEKAKGAMRSPLMSINTSVLSPMSKKKVLNDAIFDVVHSFLYDDESRESSSTTETPKKNDSSECASTTGFSTLHETCFTTSKMPMLSCTAVHVFAIEICLALFQVSQYEIIHNCRTFSDGIEVMKNVGKIVTDVSELLLLTLYPDCSITGVERDVLQGWTELQSTQEESEERQSNIGISALKEGITSKVDLESQQDNEALSSGQTQHDIGKESSTCRFAYGSVLPSLSIKGSADWHDLRCFLAENTLRNLRPHYGEMVTFRAEKIENTYNLVTKQNDMILSLLNVEEKNACTDSTAACTPVGLDNPRDAQVVDISPETEHENDSSVPVQLRDRIARHNKVAHLATPDSKSCNNCPGTVELTKPLLDTTRTHLFVENTHTNGLESHHRRHRLSYASPRHTYTRSSAAHCHVFAPPPTSPPLRNLTHQSNLLVHNCTVSCLSPSFFNASPDLDSIKKSGILEESEVGQADTTPLRPVSLASGSHYLHAEATCGVVRYSPHVGLNTPSNEFAPTATCTPSTSMVPHIKSPSTPVAITLNLHGLTPIPSPVDLARHGTSTLHAKPFISPSTRLAFSPHGNAAGALASGMEVRGDRPMGFASPTSPLVSLEARFARESTLFHSPLSPQLAAISTPNYKSPHTTMLSPHISSPLGHFVVKRVQLSPLDSLDRSARHGNRMQSPEIVAVMAHASNTEKQIDVTSTDETEKDTAPAAILQMRSPVLRRLQFANTPTKPFSINAQSLLLASSNYFRKESFAGSFRAHPTAYSETDQDTDALQLLHNSLDNSSDVKRHGGNLVTPSAKAIKPEYPSARSSINYSSHPIFTSAHPAQYGELENTNADGNAFGKEEGIQFTTPSFAEWPPVPNVQRNKELVPLDSSGLGLFESLCEDMQLVDSPDSRASVHSPSSQFGSPIASLPFRGQLLMSPALKSPVALPAAESLGNIAHARSKSLGLKKSEAKTEKAGSSQSIVHSSKSVDVRADENSRLHSLESRTPKETELKPLSLTATTLSRETSNASITSTKESTSSSPALFPTVGPTLTTKGRSGSTSSLDLGDTVKRMPVQNSNEVGWFDRLRSNSQRKWSIVDECLISESEEEEEEEEESEHMSDVNGDDVIASNRGVPPQTTTALSTLLPVDVKPSSEATSVQPPQPVAPRPSRALKTLHAQVMVASPLVKRLSSWAPESFPPLESHEWGTETSVESHVLDTALMSQENNIPIASPTQHNKSSLPAAQSPGSPRLRGALQSPKLQPLSPNMVQDRSVISKATMKETTEVENKTITATPIRPLSFKLERALSFMGANKTAATETSASGSVPLEFRPEIKQLQMLSPPVRRAVAEPSRKL